MSDEDHALSNDSCFNNDMENDDDIIEVILGVQKSSEL